MGGGLLCIILMNLVWEISVKMKTFSSKCGQDTCENGDVFRGYYGFYIWRRWFDILEFNCHIEPDSDSKKLTGFTSHISSNCFWHLAVADTQQEFESDEEDDGEEYTYFPGQCRCHPRLS